MDKLRQLQSLLSKLLNKINHNEKQQYTDLSDAASYLKRIQKINDSIYNEILRLIGVASAQSSVDAADIKLTKRILSKYGDTSNSRLRKVFDRLSIKAKEAVVSGDKELDDFHQYLHVARPIEAEIESVFRDEIPNERQTLTLIVGNVGDGKSHLLAYEKSRHNDDFIKYNIRIHNDATESLDPRKTAIESLKNTLANFNRDDSKPEHLIVAINLGVLINFAKMVRKQGEFTDLLAFLDKTEILVKETATTYIENRFQLITFRNSPSIKFTEGTASSDFVKSILTKITSTSDENPFYSAYQEDKAQKNLPEVVNYQLLMNPSVQTALESLLIRIQIQYGQMLSTRQILNFIHDVVIPISGSRATDAYLPSLLFTGEKSSNVLRYVAKLDPVLNQHKEIDKIISRLFNTHDFIAETRAIFSELALDDAFEQNEPQLNELKGINELDKNNELAGQSINYVIRLLFLLKHQSPAFSNQTYNKYVQVLGAVDESDSPDKQKIIREFKKELIQGILLWNGVSPKQRYIFKDAIEQNVAVQIVPRFAGDLNRQGVNVRFAIRVNQTAPVSLTLDFQTYAMLQKIINGYNLRHIDMQNAVDFNQYVQQLVSNANSSSNSALVRIPNTNRFIEITDNDYEYTVEEVN